MKPMSFEQSRQKLLKKLDADFRAIAAVVQDPDWCNELFPPFKKAMEGMGETLGQIQRLNACQHEAKRLEAECPP